MTTYKTLYHLMVQNMSEAIDLYDAGKGILARPDVVSNRHPPANRGCAGISSRLSPNTVYVEQIILLNF